MNRRNTGVILLGDGREGISAFHGIENSRFTLCFHQSVDFGLHGRIVISGSSEAVFAVGTVSPFAVQHFLGELVHGLSQSDRIRSDGAGIVLRYAIATDVFAVDLQRASADRIALISFDDGDGLAGNLLDDTDVIWPAGVVSGTRILPVIEDNIAGRREISIIFNPLTELLEKANEQSACAR